MTLYLVDIEQHTHTCPADADPHPVDIRRTIVHITDSGPCRAPVTIRLADTSTVIPCGRHEPAERQCGACRPIVTERTITTTLDGITA
ncbi:hypothetical protein [Micromonospora sp. CPCC 206061]|uniref:hypothetical protein n=1 Tax=Micromonospora sp. CPCC 206061 TaxID=3122410 RepID=UPI002FF41310